MNVTTGLAQGAAIAVAHHGIICKYDGGTKIK